MQNNKIDIHPVRDRERERKRATEKKHNCEINSNAVGSLVQQLF